MTQATIFKPENRLAEILAKLGGDLPEDLVLSAEKRLEVLQDGIRTYVAAQVQGIMAIHSQGEEAMFGACREVGDLAMNIAEVAGAARLGALGEVACGICAMVDSLVQAGVWHSDALDLHIGALTVLNSNPGPSEAEQHRVLNRLRDMRQAIGVIE